MAGGVFCLAVTVRLMEGAPTVDERWDLDGDELDLDLPTEDTDMPKDITWAERQEAARVPHYGRVWFRDGSFIDRRFSDYEAFERFRRYRNKCDTDIRDVEDLGVPLSARPQPEPERQVCQWEPGCVVDLHEGMHEQRP